MIEEMPVSNKVTSDKKQMSVEYGQVGLAIYLVSVGLIYLIPNDFPDGTLYVWAGILIFIVTILNLLKGITYDWFNIIFATFAIVIGVNKIFEPRLELGFLPVMLIIVGIVILFSSIKRVKAA